MPRSNSERLLADMQKTVNTMWERLLSIVKIELTYREALLLTMPREDAEVLHKASKLAGNIITPAIIRASLGDAAPGFDLVVNAGYELAPKVGWLQRADNMARRKRFDEWLELRLQLGRDWGRVDAVLTRLAAACTTPAQMRKRFPAIRAIWQSDPDMAALANKYEAFNRNLRAPFLPADLAEAALVAGTTLVTYTTLPRIEAKPPTPAVLLVRHSQNEPPMHEDPNGFRFAMR